MKSELYSEDVFRKAIYLKKWRTKFSILSFIVVERKNEDNGVSHGKNNQVSQQNRNNNGQLNSDASLTNSKFNSMKGVQPKFKIDNNTVVFILGNLLLTDNEKFGSGLSDNTPQYNANDGQILVNG